MKKILIILTCLCFVFSITAMTTLASVGDEVVIEPMAENYNTANAYLSIEGGTATCETIVNGISGKTSKIMIMNVCGR